MRIYLAPSRLYEALAYLDTRVCVFNIMFLGLHPTIFGSLIFSCVERSNQDRLLQSHS
jgi:hypothetical protein